MAIDDIYKSKKTYEKHIRRIRDKSYLKRIRKDEIYYVKNPDNLKYFEQLIKEFEFKDTSYIRRDSLFKVLKKTCYFTTKDLKDLTQDDVKDIVTEVRKIFNKTSFKDWWDKSQFLAKILFPEMDSQGRPLPDIVPYAWRFKFKTDKSSQKDREDKITDTEYMKIQRSMNRNPMYQLWFSLLYTNLARPQSLSYIDTSNIEVKDNYARVRISEHGKEGTQTLQLVDNYYYLVKWLEVHPLYDPKHPDTKGIPLFVTQSNNKPNKRLPPKAANKYLQNKLKKLGITKHLTNYSFKRNGVTHRYIAGESAQNIQKIAGWTSTDQIKTYDLSQQEEFLKKELEDKGIIKSDGKQKKVNYKLCAFYNTINTISAGKCSKCQRSLDREQILKEEADKDKKVEDLQKQMDRMDRILEELKKEKEIEVRKK